jgi:hypothetical protein
VLQDCEEGDQVRLEFDDAVADRAVVILSCESGRRPLQDADCLARLTSLAHQVGASLSADDRLVVSVPMRARDAGEPDVSAAERERLIPRDATELGGGEPRDDVRGTRQRQHGETGAH